MRDADIRGVAVRGPEGALLVPPSAFVLGPPEATGLRFTGAAKTASAAVAGALRLLAVDEAGRERDLGSFALEEAADTESLVELVWRRLGRGGVPGPELLRRFVAPLLAPASAERKHKAYTLHPGEATPRLSVIVPLYGEGLFIRSLVLQQRRCPPDWEWVFVCDDPRLVATVGAHLLGRKSFLTARTTLILNEEPYGFGGAINIGLAHAAGEIALLMNSDIWLEGSAPLEQGAGALAEYRYDLLGFRLRFPDGTLQHDGIAFRRSPGFAGLYLAEHPGKGGPEPADLPALAPTLAVTGALLMARTADLRELGGFDEGYLRGDFEDADLCLRARDAGLQVGILRAPGLVHLERQSFPALGSDGLRTAVTYLNGLRFTERWGGLLDGMAAEGRPAGSA